MAFLNLYYLFKQELLFYFFQITPLTGLFQVWQKKAANTREIAYIVNSSFQKMSIFLAMFPGNRMIV